MTKALRAPAKNCSEVRRKALIEDFEKGVLLPAILDAAKP